MPDLSETPPSPSVRFYRPSPQLADLITSYHVVDVTQPLRDYIHPEWANIRLLPTGRWTSRPIGGEIDSPPGRASLYGPTDFSRQVDSDHGMLVGIGLTPLGWMKLIGRNAAAHANTAVALDGLLGVDDEVLAQSMAHVSDEDRVAQLNALFEARHQADGVEEPLVRRIHQVLVSNTAPDVAALVEASGISERTLQRLCLRAFGFAPKRLLRRQRFMRTLHNITERSDLPIGAMLDEDYHDQAQFIREFQAYMGMTPTAYFRLPRVLLNRSAIERRRVLGEHFQLLHPPGSGPTADAA